MSRIDQKYIDDAKRVAEASTGGDVKYGWATPTQFIKQVTWLDKVREKAESGSEDRVWITWQRNPDVDKFSAITGDGPTSEANARFFASARDIVLTLIEEINRLQVAVAHSVPRLRWSKIKGDPVYSLGRAEAGGRVVADVMSGVGYFLWRVFNERDVVVDQGWEETKTLAKRAAERACSATEEES